MSLYDLSKREASESVFRLKEVSLAVPTEEQRAKAKATIAEKGNTDYGPQLSLKVVWEPLLYRKFIGDDQVTEEVDYITITKSNQLTDEALPLIREAGMKAVHPDMLVKLPSKPEKADPAKQPQQYPRFMVAATKAGLVLDVDENGQITSPSVGKIFRCTNGYEEFPRGGQDAKGNFRWDWEDTRSTYMRLPLAEVTDFVQPEDIPEYRYERRDDESGDREAATTTTSAGGGGAGDLGAAVKALGIDGKPVGVIDANGAAIITNQIAAHPVLATIYEQVATGKLSDVLTAQGVARVEDGVIHVD